MNCFLTIGMLPLFEYKGSRWCWLVSQVDWFHFSWTRQITLVGAAKKCSSVKFGQSSVSTPHLEHFFPERLRKLGNKKIPFSRIMVLKTLQERRREEENQAVMISQKRIKQAKVCGTSTSVLAFHLTFLLHPVVSSRRRLMEIKCLIEQLCFLPLPTLQLIGISNIKISQPLVIMFYVNMYFWNIKESKMLTFGYQCSCNSCFQFQHLILKVCRRGLCETQKRCFPLMFL